MEQKLITSIKEKKINKPRKKQIIHILTLFY